MRKIKSFKISDLIMRDSNDIVTHVDRNMIHIPGARRVRDILKRVNSVCQIAVLEDVLTGHTLIVANTHLFSPPPMRNIRLIQAFQILREIEKIKMELAQKEQGL